ncbi:TIGR03084 family metal-binding protein [Catenulispora rubra]|uniref:TIGR03084 family metal-binding protein n=1 Tax=Catenulispora rubra TaxID=280293 RepID=UPI001892701A|nr:TIGR03084 family metal-binding protein [Catenulispora rubra]
MAVLDDLLEDLAAESGVLDALVTPLDAAAWRTETPAPGWTIAHQIAHLAWTDRVAALAARDPDAFNAMLTRALQEGGAGFVDQQAEKGAQLAPSELLAAWRADRHNLARALPEVPPGGKLPWFGPPMGAATMATARLMETWAHGQDIADALGVRREPTARLRNVAHLGVRTRDFAFVQRGLPVPDAEFRIELTAPDGGSWTWGPETATERVTGPALDFCLLVAQRRHRDDLAVQAVGSEADQWLDIAQVFAGPSGPGRSKGQFA